VVTFLANNICEVSVQGVEHSTDVVQAGSDLTIEKNTNSTKLVIVLSLIQMVVAITAIVICCISADNYIDRMERFYYYNSTITEEVSQ